MRVLLARTSCVTSLTILAFSLGDRVVNHFARRYKGVSLLVSAKAVGVIRRRASHQRRNATAVLKTRDDRASYRRSENSPLCPAATAE